MTPIGSVARALLGAVFVGSGVLALRNPERHARQVKPLADRLGPTLEAAKLPTDPQSLVKLNGAVQLAGGLLLVTGHATRPAAAALAASLVPSTIAAHPFWSETDPQRRADQEVQFVKNLGLLGGLLLAAVDRHGRPSLAWRTRYAAKRARQSAKHAGTTAGLTGVFAAKQARSTAKQARIAAKYAGRSVSDTVGNAAWRATGAARDAGRSVRRGARTARIAVDAARFGRRLPF